MIVTRWSGQAGQPASLYTKQQAEGKSCRAASRAASRRFRTQCGRNLEEGHKMRRLGHHLETCTSPSMGCKNRLSSRWNSGSTEFPHHRRAVRTGYHLDGTPEAQNFQELSRFKRGKKIKSMQPDWETIWVTSLSPSLKPCVPGFIHHQGPLPPPPFFSFSSSSTQVSHASS